TVVIRAGSRDATMNRLARFIHDCRRRFGLSEYELARDFGYSPTWLRGIEWRGFTQRQRDTLRLADRFGISPNEAAQLDGCWTPTRPADVNCARQYRSRTGRPGAVSQSRRDHPPRETVPLARRRCSAHEQRSDRFPVPAAGA